MRKNRVQVLPVQWRTTFGVSMEEAAQRASEGLDNRFSLDGGDFFFPANRCAHALQTSP